MNEELDIRVVHHEVTLSNTTVQCVAEVGETEIAYWWGPDDGIVPDTFDGVKFDKLSKAEQEYIENWSAIAHEIIFAGSGYR